jgi:hypothetical protein
MDREWEQIKKRTGDYHWERWGNCVQALVFGSKHVGTCGIKEVFEGE